MSRIPTARAVHHIGYNVPDLDEAVRFFEDVVGAELIFRAGPFGGSGIATSLDVDPETTIEIAHLRVGRDTNLELQELHAPDQVREPPRNSDVGAAHLAIYVDDLDAALAYLKATPGVRALGEPLTHGPGQPHDGLRNIFVVTPFGMPIELITYPRPLPYERSARALFAEPAPGWQDRPERNLPPNGLARRQLFSAGISLGAASIFTGGSAKAEGIRVPEAPLLVPIVPDLRSGVERVRVAVPQERLDRIMRRVRDYEWREQSAIGGWRYGTDSAYLQTLCAYWLERYDWRSAERAINGFSHYRAAIDGNAWHFVHERGSGPNPQPLLILHGWPYSFWDFLPLVERLAHPERFGGKVEDAFSVVIPSIPGTGFSYKPSRPIGPRSLVSPLNRLMVDVLGHEQYIVQGADWGALIAPWLALQHSRNVRALHLNQIIVRHDGAAYGSGETGLGPATAEERAFVRREREIWLDEDGYFKEQATRPETLGYGMMDSPVGVAAWLVEKFYKWSDLPNGDLEAVFTKDQILTEIMIYLVSRTFKTATWFYAGTRDEASPTLPAGARVGVPVGFLALLNEPLSPPAPRSFLERAYNIVHWSESDHGGHFAALEVPDRLLADIRSFRRAIA